MSRNPEASMINNDTLARQQQPEAGIGRVGTVALLGIGAGLGIAGYVALMGEHSQETQEAQITQTEIYHIESDIRTIIATPHVGVGATVESKWDSPDIRVPGIGNIGLPDDVSTFRIAAPGDYDLTVDVAFAELQRKQTSSVSSEEAFQMLADNEGVVVTVDGVQYESKPAQSFSGGTEQSVSLENTQVRPDDTVKVTIDRSSLKINRARINAELYGSDITVENGFITEKNGVELKEPVPVIANDGEYEIPRLQTTGQDSAYSDGIEGLVYFGSKDLHEEADETLLAAAQLGVASPVCLDTIFEQVNLDELTESSFRKKIQELNTDLSDKQITILLTGEWPEAEEIVDEDGSKYEERVALFNKNNTSSSKVTLSDSCDLSNITEKN